MSGYLGSIGFGFPAAMGAWAATGGHRKVIAVTGAARGMGRAHVDACIQLGARVLMIDVLDDLGSQAAQEHGSHVKYTHADVSDEHDWARALEAGLATFGRLDGLVNNAGILLPKSMADTTGDEYDRVCAINQKGVFLGMKAAAPILRDNGGGSIATSRPPRDWWESASASPTPPASSPYAA